MSAITDYGYADDYHSFQTSRASWLDAIETSSARYVPMSERRDTTSIYPDTIKAMQRGKYMRDWKGIQMLKDPLDTTIYETMIWKIKPTTILEVGAYKGASAPWLADHLRMFNISGHVYSMDIDLSLLDKRVQGREGITFIEGDCNKIEESFPSDFLQNLPHPWILIEDAHVNLSGVLEHFYGYLETGDYFIVEDTTPAACRSIVDVLNDRERARGLTKMTELRRFVEKHPGDLMVDCYYTDMFGYNATWNINGFIRKM